MASFKHSKQAVGDNNPDRQVSVQHWNAEHTVGGTANYLLGFDGSGNATDVNPATLVIPASAQQVANRTALAALATSSPVAYLAETGREGTFVWSSANNAANVTADPQQAIYVAPASAPTGVSGAWVRKYSGAKNAKWFGAVIDGATDDSVALQAWLDSGGLLHLPAGQAYSSATLILRKNAIVEGAGYTDVSLAVSYITQPQSRIRFAAGAAGLNIQPRQTITDVATAIAAGAAGVVQDGAMHSVIRNLALIGAGTGAVVTGLYCRTLVHLDQVHVITFTGKGFDFSASSDTPDGNSEYGTASLSTLLNCKAVSNGSHGFHIRGRDANILKLDSCNAQLNGGWGFLDESLLGNTYIAGQAATNTTGSFKCIGSVANSIYVGCYDETGTGQNCDISRRCTVLGGALPGPAISNNAASLGYPTVINESGVTLDAYLTIIEAVAALGATTDRAHIYRHANLGLVLQGVANGGGAFDVTLKNKSDVDVVQVDTGGTRTRFAGQIMAATDILINGNSGWGGIITGQADILNHATYGLTMGGFGSTNDTTLVNRSGAIVLGVTASTVNVTAAGALAATGAVTGSNLSGTNTGDQYTALAGISVVGRSANSSGAAAAITAVTDGHVLRLSGTTLGFGTVAAAAMPALTGDVTTSAGAVATTLATNIVTYAKFQQVAASSLVGNPTGSLANAQGITLAGGLAFSGTTLTAAGALTPTSVASTGAISGTTVAATSSILSSGATNGIGYATGSGGAVTQLTSRTTGVTLSKICGAITLFSAAGSTTYNTFTVTNTAVAATDVIEVSQKSGANLYNVLVTAVGAGSFNLSVSAVSGTATEAPVINFTVLKAVAA